MTLLVCLTLIATLALAFANGANDNSKGVATLVGCGAWPSRRALFYAAATTFAGSVAAIWFGAELAAKFSGKGIVDLSLMQHEAFPDALGIAAAATVLLATVLAMPISTTHAMVGGMIGIATAAEAIKWSAVVKAFVLPLMLSPLIAMVGAFVFYILMRQLRRSLGISRATCLCIEEKVVPLSVDGDGVMCNAITGTALTVDEKANCQDRYDGVIAGVDAQATLRFSHFVTAGTLSFARGLNDTPKVAALMLTAGVLSDWSIILLCGVLIAVGGLIAVRRVAETMSQRITGMNDGQAFSANAVAAVLVILATMKFAVPVSTTHTSCGALFGIGAANGRAHWKMVAQILLAWVTTLPIAAGLGYACWSLLA